MADIAADEKLTIEWLVANGFKPVDVLGYVRELSRGPGESVLELCVGTYPFNDPCACILIGGYGVVTNAASCADILDLVRLLDGAPIDHPYEAWIGGEDDDEEPSAESVKTEG